MKDDFKPITDNDIRNIFGGMVTDDRGMIAKSECLIFERPANGEDECCSNFVYKSLDIEYSSKKYCRDCRYFKSN